MSGPTASLGLMRMIEAVPTRLDGAPRQLRRFWSDEFKATAVEQACQPGANMSAVARQIGILPSQLYRWRRELLVSNEAHRAAGAEEALGSVCGPTMSSRLSLVTSSCALVLMPMMRICSV